MLGALIILAFTAAIGLVLWLLDRRGRRGSGTAPEGASEAPEGPEEAPAEGECCGLHISCEKDSLAVFSTEVEYFDDEELDAFAGRAAEEYTAAEEEQFRDVLLTMRPDEIAAWSRSLQLRGVTLPTAIRDELLLIVAEARAAKTSD